VPFQTIGSPALWSGFLALVALMLFVDLGLFHRKSHVVGLKEAAAWSVVWVLLAALASGAVYVWFGADRAVEFATGYLIEKALAVDNIFVFVVIFGAFGVPALYQHRVLFWSVLGALAMRAAFVLVGGAPPAVPLPALRLRRPARRDGREALLPAPHAFPCGQRGRPRRPPLAADDQRPPRRSVLRA